MKTLNDIIETRSYERLSATQVGFNNPAAMLVLGFNLTAISDEEYYESIYFDSLIDIAKFLEKLGGHNFSVYDYKYFSK
jgi:hypothetical protein